MLNNRYQIIQALSSGGFGTTFLAEDTQMPSGRNCVIKQLIPIVNDPKVYQLVQERFKREAAVLEDLGKQNNQIPELYAYFTEAGQFYLVQEWIEGETLTQKVQRERLLNEGSVKEILINILPVLEYIHSKQIIHRDIKPDNIIIRHQDGKPVLIDFGAVRETMGTAVTNSGSPISSIMIGTPGFMPVEQSAGRPVYSSDLYSLGLTAIYLLTGKMPQELEVDAQTGEIVWEHYALKISSTFRAVLDQAIQSHARDRFSNTKQMLDALFSANCKKVSPTLQEAGAAYVPPETVSFPPPTRAAYQPQIVSPQPFPPKTELSDWQKVVIIGGIIGAFIVGGSWLLREKSPASSSATPVAQETSFPKSDNKLLKHTTEIPVGNYSFYENSLHKHVSYIRSGNKMVGALYDSQQPDTITCFAANIGDDEVNVTWWNNLWQINHQEERLDRKYSIDDFTIDNIGFRKGLENPASIEKCQYQG